jgi:hypothetical protein
MAIRILNLGHQIEPPVHQQYPNSGLLHRYGATAHRNKIRVQPRGEYKVRMGHVLLR